MEEYAVHETICGPVLNRMIIVHNNTPVYLYSIVCIYMLLTMNKQRKYICICICYVMYIVYVTTQDMFFSGQAWIFHIVLLLTLGLLPAGWGQITTPKPMLCYTPCLIFTPFPEGMLGKYIHGPGDWDQMLQSSLEQDDYSSQQQQHLFIYTQ